MAQSFDGDGDAVGVGENLFAAGDVRGEARWFRTPADVVSAGADDLAGVIAFVAQGGMTFLSPVLPDVTAVVCTAGSLESHLALLAREFEKPCVMGTRLDAVVADGDRIVLHLADSGRARITTDRGDAGAVLNRGAMAQVTRKALKRLATDLDYSPSLEEWNWLIDRIGRAYKAELSRRTMFESELFPLNSYITMGHLEDYLQLPDRLRMVNAKQSAEEIVRSRLHIGSKINFICLAAIMLHYLAGRELFIELSDIDQSSDLEDHLVVLDFWRRATIALRTDGVLTNMDGEPPDSAKVIDDTTLARVANDLVPIDSGTLSTVRQLSAQLMAYCFLENCDSRMAVCDTGPYPLGGGQFLCLRELCTDTGDFEWTEGIRQMIPHHNFVIAYGFGDDVQMENNVWGTAWFTPHDYLKHLAKVRVYITDTGSLQPLTVAEMRPLTASVRRAHKELYVRYAQMSRKERAICATEMYAWKLKGWARAAGVFDDIDWALSPRVLHMYDRLLDNDYALKLLGDVFVPPDRDSCFRPLE